MKNKFNWQSFFSIGLLLTFILMFFSGIVLYIAPEGSLSRWIGWDVFSLTKKQWEQQHTIFSYLFVLFSIFHVFKINWSFLVSYLVIEKFRLANLKEILIAVTITVLVFAGTLYRWSPFEAISSLGSKISDSYTKNVEMPDVQDAEKLTIKMFTEKVFDLNYINVEIILNDHNFSIVEPEILVIDFCKQNKISPEELFKIIKDKSIKEARSGGSKVLDISSFSTHLEEKESLL